MDRAIGAGRRTALVRCGAGMIRRILALLRKPVEAPQTASDAARTLSRAGHAKARQRVLQVAQRMRAELGLKPDARLG